MALTTLNTGLVVDEVQITRLEGGLYDVRMKGRQVVGTKLYPVATGPLAAQADPATEANVNNVLADLNTRADNLVEYITGE